jgi:uncharacterized surface protein with fasciclin (FAS1) repeats
MSKASATRNSVSRAILGGEDPSAPTNPRSKASSAPKQTRESSEPVTIVTCKTETIILSTLDQINDRFTTLGYGALAWFSDGGNLVAILAETPLGHRVIVRVTSDITAPNDAFDVEVSDDSPIDGEIANYFAQRLIPAKGISNRIETDFAIMDYEGMTIWYDDNAHSMSYLYSDAEAVSKVSSLEDGWFALASTRLDELREPTLESDGIIDKLMSPPNDVGSFGVLLELLKHTGLDDVLRMGSYTLLAPTDDAFDTLPPGTIESLMKYEQRDALMSILAYHVYPSRELANSIGANPTLQGEKIVWDKGVDLVTANGTPVSLVNWKAGMGVIHVLDGVLKPTTLTNPISHVLRTTTYYDINDTTNYIRVALRGWAEYQKKRLMKTVEALNMTSMMVEKMVDETFDMLGPDILRKTRSFSKASMQPDEVEKALTLNKQLMVENEAFDASVIDQAELTSLITELAALTERVKALTTKGMEVLHPKTAPSTRNKNNQEVFQEQKVVMTSEDIRQ